MLALQNASVDILVQDVGWSGKEGDLYKEMLELSSPVNNFGNLRQRQGESLKMIPFFGLYLSDLVLAEHSVKNPTDITDWSGYRRIGELIRNFQDVQSALKRQNYQPKSDELVSTILEQQNTHQQEDY